MKEQVLDYIRRYQMIEKGDHVITGVSGGADSVCLLFVLVLLQDELDLKLTAVHVDHQLRGEKAREDAAFTEQLCKKWKVAYRQYSYPVGDIAAKRGISVEEAGRQVRYECFETVRAASHGDKIAVAHNEDDQAETVLMNLVRGSGLKGLGGIPPVRERIVRPLLGTKRSQIEAFLAEQGIAYRTDQTNFEDDYTRNKLRLHVLPYLKKEINNQVVTHISESSEIIQQADAYIWKEAEKADAAHVCDTGKGRLLNQSLQTGEAEIIQNYVILKELRGVAGTQRDLTAVHIRAVSGLFDKQTGRKVTLPYGITAERTYEGIEIRKEQQAPECDAGVLALPVPPEGSVCVPGSNTVLTTCVEKRGGSEIIPENEYTKWFDYDIIKGDLQLRTRLPGDYFMLNKDGGRKKLKLFFRDQKIPREKRGQMLLLAEGSHVLWIPGYRISAYYKVTEQTENILKVQLDGGK